METNESTSIMNINKNGSKKRIIAITVISVILIVLLTVIAIQSEIFVSKGQRFVKLLTTDQYAIELVNNRKEELIDTNEKKYSVTLKNNFLAMLDSTFSLIGGDLVLDVDKIKKGDNFDVSANLNLGSFELQSLDIIKENDNYAISVPNLFENYVIINNENAYEVAKKLGFISGDIESEDFSNEAKKIIYKYGKILISSIEDYIILENVQTEVNGENLNTDRYKIVIGEKELALIELYLLEELKDDDETIKFIAKCIQNSEEISNLVKEKLTEETLKKDILDLYDKTLDTVNEITGGRQILEISLYEWNGKAVKTVINIQTLDEVYEITISSISSREKDYALVTFNLVDIILNLEYQGVMSDGDYSGEIVVSTDGASIPILEINIQNVEDKAAEIRKINDLQALFLNKASDEELKSLKEEIEMNLGITQNNNPYDESNAVVYEEGEFKLDNPENRVNALEDSKKAYNTVKLNMTKDEVVKLFGEPSMSYEITDGEIASWYYGDSTNVYLISIAFENGKVFTIYNNITSSMEDNIQISYEVGTEINDLNQAIEDVNLDMTKDEVINILGDKYLEVYKDVENYFGIKWYDKNENSVVIEFDNNGKVFYINEVTMDM